MRALTVSVIATAALILATGTAWPRTWYVKPDSTGDVPTISVAVDSAAAQVDTVLLADGIFEGTGNREVDCLDKAVTIVSESGDPEACIIDCGYPPVCNERLVALYFRESSHGTPRLEGVTIRDGCGGVICDVGSAPVISNCIFRDNRCGGCEVGYQGAGMICAANSAPIIEDCLFVENYADGGGGLCCKGSYPTLSNVTFLNNSGTGGGGMLTENGGFARLTGCMFSGNHVFSPFGSRAGGGGMCCRASASIEDCHFEDNLSRDYPGGGLCVIPDSESDHFSVTRCTFVGNAIHNAYYPGGGLSFIGNGTATVENTLVAFNYSGGGVYRSGSSAVSLICCDIHGKVGGDWTGLIEDQLGIKGNISADPLFCDTLGGDFRLETCSPCLPGNHPDGYDCGVPIGAYCSGCPCGSATEPATWGAIKAMYR